MLLKNTTLHILLLLCVVLAFAQTRRLQNDSKVRISTQKNLILTEENTDLQSRIAALNQTAQEREKLFWERVAERDAYFAAELVLEKKAAHGDVEKAKEVWNREYKKSLQSHP